MSDYDYNKDLFMKFLKSFPIRRNVAGYEVIFNRKPCDRYIKFYADMGVEQPSFKIGLN